MTVHPFRPTKEAREAVAKRLPGFDDAIRSLIDDTPLPPISREAQRFFGRDPFDLDAAVYGVLQRAANRNRIRVIAHDIRALRVAVARREAELRSAFAGRHDVTPKEGAR